MDLDVSHGGCNFFLSQVTVSLGARALLHCTVIGASHRTVCIAMAITMAIAMAIIVIVIAIVIVFVKGVLGACR